MDSTASGWYPDPLDSHMLRYWDSARWTVHRINLLNNQNERDLDYPAELSSAAPPASESAVTNPLLEGRKKIAKHHRPTPQVLFAVFIFILIGIAGFILLAHFSVTDDDLQRQYKQDSPQSVKLEPQKEKNTSGVNNGN